MRSRLPKAKLIFLSGILVVYLVIALGLAAGVSSGIIPRSLPLESGPVMNDSLHEGFTMPVLPHLRLAQGYFEDEFVREDGHINLYLAYGLNKSAEDNGTNSEAASYYLLWTAKEMDKAAFDRELDFIERHMLEPTFGYMMWRLDDKVQAVDDSTNIATDADLRAIKALLIAERLWKEERYTLMIDRLASGLEQVGVTKDGYLAPYGGVSGESAWTADEVWLSYSDFTVFRELAARRGGPWSGIYDRMKKANLNAQIANGLYNSMLTKERVMGNGIDAGGYSINSMWIMVRNAESNDADLMLSAKRSLQFYKEKYAMDTELYSQYHSNGDPLSPSDTPWVYALVGRAAIALDDHEFSQVMIGKLIEKQVLDNRSVMYGAFPEGSGDYVGQFTMQETILTLQDYNGRY